MSNSLDGKMNGHNQEHVDMSSFWKQQTQILEQIKQSGGFASYAATLLNLSEAFQADRDLKCIDEGTENGLHAAGSGIAYVITRGLSKGLNGYEAIDVGVNAAADTFKEASVSGIYSHEECGAAKLAYGLFSDDFKLQLEKDHEIKTADDFGDYFAKELAKRLGKDYNGRIKIDEMARPSGSHVTRVTYIDGTGNFNPSALEGLPQGFVISRKYLGAEQTGVETVVSIDIATGDHGFGDRITPEQPHVLVAVGNPNDPKTSTQALMEELKPLAATYDGKVIVDGFTAPMVNKI
jgi:hypothetical protein